MNQVKENVLSATSSEEQLYFLWSKLAIKELYTETWAFKLEKVIDLFRFIVKRLSSYRIESSRTSRFKSCVQGLRRHLSRIMPVLNVSSGFVQRIRYRFFLLFRLFLFIYLNIQR